MAETCHSEIYLNIYIYIFLFMAEKSRNIYSLLYFCFYFFSWRKTAIVKEKYEGEQNFLAGLLHLVNN